MESFRLVPGHSSKIKSTNPKLILFRDGVRLGEWLQDEVRHLYATGLIHITDHYCREGASDRHPLQTLLQPVRKANPSIFS